MQLIHLFIQSQSLLFTYSHCHSLVNSHTYTVLQQLIHILAE